MSTSSLPRWHPQALVEEDQLLRAAAVALVDREERRERRIEQERVDEARRALEMERVMRRLKAMTESARTGKTVTIYEGQGLKRVPVTGPWWLAEQPPYGTAEAERWELRRNGLVGKVTTDVRRGMAEKDRLALAAAEVSDSSGSESSYIDRDTDFSPVSSAALPADPAWSRSQARFEDAVGDGAYLADPYCERFGDAVGDGAYFADPYCESEEEVEETKHGGS